MLPRFAVADVHRFAALAGTLLVVLHLALLFFDPYAQLRLVDFVVPFLGAYRPLWLGLGTLAFDLLAVVIVTSLLRHRLGVRIFRAVHWATYALWPVALAHALGNGTDAGHRWFLVFAGCCALIGGRRTGVATATPTTPNTPTREHRRPMTRQRRHARNRRHQRLFAAHGPGSGRTPAAVRPAARLGRQRHW